MKAFINRLLILLTITTIAVGCEDDEMVVINENFSTTVALSDDDIVLEEDNEAQPALTVSWSEPDFGYDAAAEYNILFTLGEKVQTVNAGRPPVMNGMMNRMFTTGDLNRIMLNLEAEPGTPASVDVHVDIVMSKQYKRSSETVSFTATAYSGVLDLTTPWGVVGSATPNGWDGPDIPFYKTSDDGVYVAYATLVDGEWKIRKDNDWTVNYGDNGADGTLEQDGANIAASAGTYRILFDENALTYTVETYSWGLVGSATPNGWDGPDIPLTFDPCSDTWRVITDLGDGEWKIRQNNDWGLNYGDDGADGTLEQGGANITVSAGKYLVIVDFNNLTYTIEEIALYGVVGSGTPNGWDGPDIPFFPDFCNEGLYYAYDVTLSDGEIKFRLDNDWGVNYGDNGGDGILERDGANIPSTAGVYDIPLDFTNPSVPTYTITAK